MAKLDLLALLGSSSSTSVSVLRSGASCSLTSICCRVTPDSKNPRGLADLSWKDRDIDHRMQPEPLVGPSDQVLARLLPTVRPDLTTDSIVPLTTNTESAFSGRLGGGW
jgi:hypothetical protein